jgi:cytidylate kinase
MTLIAIDGPGGSGKSTVARHLADRLGLDYLDTGAMYRAVAFAALRRGIDPSDEGPVAHLVDGLELSVDDLTVTVDGVDATIEIRGPEVTRAVSLVAANPAVRTELRSRQREWAAGRHGGGVVGRDIGTVVFPDADAKFFLTASPEERARRRHAELRAKGDPSSFAEVLADQLRRDRDDSERAVAPLRPAPDATVLDTSGVPLDDVVEQLVREVRARLARRAG